MSGLGRRYVRVVSTEVHDAGPVQVDCVAASVPARQAQELLLWLCRVLPLPEEVRALPAAR
jgi:hypothetical protein